MYTILLVVHTILVLFLIVMVLLQRTDSDGLSGLSGGGGNQFLTGRSSANLMTRTTAILAGLFMFTSLTLAVMASRMTEGSIVGNVQMEAPAPAEKVAEEKKDLPAAPAVPKPE
jgi:preprotein translocase subunit SecG